MCRVEDFDKLKLLPYHRATIERELDLWHEIYLPVGKTVLDVGAGCGETAFFYLEHGAEKVICVESDPDAYAYLTSNFELDKRVVPILARVDSIKVDIEGSEENMILETHFPVYLKRMSGPTQVWRLTKMKNVHNAMKGIEHVILYLHYLRIHVTRFFRIALKRL